jgi:putative endonuclease
MSPDRHERGRAAEQVACDYLTVRGFTITARNRRLGPLELDIIAEKGPLLVIVEVRTRAATSWDTALGSISYEKRRNLLRAARRLWSTELRRRYEIQRVRIDVAAVQMDASGVSITYVEGAIVGG